MTTTLSNQELKQPKGLGTLFSIELWERFGFYCVQALLVLFLSKTYHLSDTQTYGVFSAFSALIYATPVIGGYIADRLIGYRHAVLTGAVLYIIGYFTLATTNHTLFYVALALLICGNGFFKGCVSSLLGTLYNGEDDPRRDSGFTIFYMGINLGSFFAPIVCTWVAVKFGWGYGFGLPGIGMIIGFIIAIIGFKKFGAHGLPPDPARLTTPIFLGLSRQKLFYVGIAIAIALLSLLIDHADLINRAFIIFSIITVIAVITFTFRYEHVQRNKMFLLIILMIFSVFFWALYFQMFSSFTLFLDRIVDRHAFGYQIPAAMYSSINPLFTIVFSPLLAVLWMKLSSSRWNPSLPRKFSLGLILLSFTFLILSFSILVANKNGMVWQGWIVISYFFLTAGELCLSPIGLSMITALAPANLTGMMMGVWFLTLALGYAVGDRIADLTSIPSNITDIHVMSAIYNSMFNHFGWICLVLGLILFVLSPLLKHLLSKN